MRGGAKAMLVAGVTGAMLVAPAGAALAQGLSRQTATVVFSEKAASSPTGATVKIRYRAPADPAGKPPAVQKIVTKFAPGTRVDTTVPAVCGASDSMLMAEGVTACPARSVVGAGAITLDTGAEGSRFVENDLALLNNTGELIMLTTVRGSSPPARAVVRGKIVGNTIVSEIPPIAGGPPDGFTAIRDVDFKVSPIVNRVQGGVRAYLTTPASCPSTRRFANSFTFTYRDGVTQGVPSPSACTQLDRTPPRIMLAGLPQNTCTKRGTLARIRVLDSSQLLLGVRLNERRVVRTKLRRVVVRLRRPALRQGRNRLTITARDAAGNRARFTRNFVRCP